MIKEKRNSEDWCKLKNIELGVDILDPDGWDRSNFDESWNEKITESQFINRVMMSTCMIDFGKDIFK